MRILVTGSGGREHALAWKIKQSRHVRELFCAPGNAGISQIATCFPADMNDAGALANLAESVGADLTVIGPEAPLVYGVADAFKSRGLRLVGPMQAAARLEGSKIFAKQFMARHKIPTAQFTACHSVESARAAMEMEFKFPVVVKADGLAAGKGVRIVYDAGEFDAAIDDFMIERAFGEAGARVVIEECLTGREASIMTFTDGRDYRVLAPAQDYKRVNDNDEGPNTGGMGAFSTPGMIDDATLEQITKTIIEPTIEGMAKEENPFAGVLYFGLMLTESGPKVLEYNVRMGDPETQPIMARLETDLVEVLDAIASGNVSDSAITWSNESSVCVVAASGGYPGSFEKGKPIAGLDEAASIEGVVVFHAGTVRDEQGSFLTSGGRVLGVTAHAPTLDEARSLAYEGVNKISFDAMHYRKDIAS